MAKQTRTTKPAKAEPRKVGDVYVGDSGGEPTAGNSGNMADPQSGLFGGNGATLDLLRPLIDQLVKAGLDALMDWLRGNAPALQTAAGIPTPARGCGDIPACPDAAGTYMLVCVSGQKSWQVVPTSLAAPASGPGEDEDDG